MANSLSQFVFILGPTAVGKSGLALDVAKSKGWPLLNCDSVQTYKHVDIGTAKPTMSEQKQVPHFLFDYLDTNEKVDAASYLKKALLLIEQEGIEKALFVGGSGFYVQALEKGLYPEVEISAAIRSEVNRWISERGFDDLHAWISENDPEYIENVSQNDHYRIRRAVEVMKSQNIKMSGLKQKMLKASSPLPPHRRLKIGLQLERDELRERVRLRTKKMLADGLVEEVESLLEKGLRDWAPLQSVGYKQVLGFLDKEIALADLPEKIVIATMQLAKKQMTWFRRDPDIEWFRGDDRKKAMARIHQWSDEEN